MSGPLSIEDRVHRLERAVFLIYDSLLAFLEDMRPEDQALLEDIAREVSSPTLPGNTSRKRERI